MKIYLSTAISGGGREYIESVHKIRDTLRSFGIEVLNERVADLSFPSPQTDRAQTMREVCAWLQEADAIIAEATISSTGIGCELTTVQMRGKPVLLLYDANFGFRISDWVVSNQDENVEARAYRDNNEIEQIVRDFVGNFLRAGS
ncbi:MAG: hypothetical protein ACE5KW_01645 [Dehalococcoidia bacterium]